MIAELAVAAALGVPGRHRDPQPVAEICGPDPVGLARGADDRRARGDVRVAALPRIRVCRRIARTSCRSPAVSVCPTFGVPEIVGADVLFGAAVEVAGSTAAVRSDCAEAGAVGVRRGDPHTHRVCRRRRRPGCRSSGCRWRRSRRRCRHRCSEATGTRTRSEHCSSVPSLAVSVSPTFAVPVIVRRCRVDRCDGRRGLGAHRGCDRGQRGNDEHEPPAWRHPSHGLPLCIDGRRPAATARGSYGRYAAVHRLENAIGKNRTKPLHRQTCARRLARGMTGV